MNLRKVFLALAISVLQVFLVTSCWAAYVIGGFSVRHQVYENGDVKYRIGFDIKEKQDVNDPTEPGTYPSIDLIGTGQLNVELWDPNGNLVTDFAPVFSAGEQAVDVEYDGKNGVYNYGLPYTYYGYSFTMDTEPIVDTENNGQYELFIYSDDLTTDLSKEFEYIGTQDLPIVSSKKIKSKVDKVNGSLLLEWPVPYSLCFTDPKLQTSSRIQILIYQGDTYKGIVNYRIPTHMGRAFVPKNLLDGIMGLGDKYLVQYQLRTNDGCNRSYSSAKVLKLPKPKK